MTNIRYTCDGNIFECRDDHDDGGGHGDDQMIKSTYLNADDDDGNHDNNHHHASSPLDRDSHLHKLHDCKSQKTSFDLNQKKNLETDAKIWHSCHL